MAEAILGFLSKIVTEVIAKGGYGGIFFLMALESANFPIPSEIIMPFAGFLASKKTFIFWAIVVIGALGNLFGSILSYWLGLKGGRPFVEKYGRYFFISSSDVLKFERWFNKYGKKIIFFSRLLPVVRTFISLPAGIFKVSFGSFSILTLTGSFIWSLILAWFGWFLGRNWLLVHIYLSSFSWLILLIILIAFAWWVWYHLFKAKKFKKFEGSGYNKDDFEN